MIRQIYQYLIAFVTLVMVIIGGVNVFNAAADLVAPSPYYQSFADYRTMHEYRYYEKNPTQELVEEKLSEEELKEQYEETVELQKEQEKQGALNRLIGNLGWIIIPLPVFLYIQRRIREEKKE